MPVRLGTIAATALLIGGVLATVAPAAAADSAKRGKIRACVDKKGADKGTMRFVRSGKCKKGERKLSWNKRGTPGETGAAGPPGEQGAPGTGATDLLALIQQQASTIETLQTTIASLQSQLAALSGQMAAVCGQLETLTSRANVLRSAINNLGLGGVIPIGLVLDIPGLPPPLSAFSCP